MKNIWQTIGAILFIIFAYNFLYSDGTKPVISNTVPHSVTYRVTGADNFSLTYETANGGTAQIDSVNKTWTESFQVPSGQFLYVSVQNGVRFGSVQCQIVVDGNIVKETKSDGAYVIATCSTSA